MRYKPTNGRVDFVSWVIKIKLYSITKDEHEACQADHDQSPTTTKNTLHRSIKSN